MANQRPDAADEDDANGSCFALHTRTARNPLTFLTRPNSARGLNVIAKRAPELREYEQRPIGSIYLSALRRAAILRVALHLEAPWPRPSDPSTRCLSPSYWRHWPSACRFWWCCRFAFCGTEI